MIITSLNSIIEFMFEIYILKLFLSQIRVIIT